MVEQKIHAGLKQEKNKMSFRKLKSDGTDRRIISQLDCSGDTEITEQAHKDDVNINNIIKRHGMDLIQRTAQLQQGVYLTDDDPTNDFQEAMNIVTKAQQDFEAMPSQIRKKFNNNPAEFLDYVQNSANVDSLVEMGLAQRVPPKPAPIEVTIQNIDTLQKSETPQP